MTIEVGGLVAPRLQGLAFRNIGANSAAVIPTVSQGAGGWYAR
jgi:hypothetical protein